jgi:hypothetical protein
MSRKVVTLLKMNKKKATTIIGDGQKERKGEQ